MGLLQSKKPKQIFIRQQKKKPKTGLYKTTNKKKPRQHKEEVKKEATIVQYQKQTIIKKDFFLFIV